MKYFLSPIIVFLLLCSFLEHSNREYDHKVDNSVFINPHLTVNKFQYGPGEYVNAFVNTQTHALYQMVEQPSHFTNLGDIWLMTIAGAHHGMAVTLDGRVGGWGDNGNGELGIGNTNAQSVPILATVDSLGNPMTNVTSVQCGGTQGWNSFCLKSDGTLWGVGDLSLGMRGNGTYGGQTTKWVQIPFPAGVKIVAYSCSAYGIAIDQNGNAYTWGAKGEYGGFGEPYILSQGTTTPNSYSPTLIHLPTGIKAVQCAGGGAQAGYVLGSNGHLYGWAYFLSYLSISNPNLNMSNFGFNPIDLNDTLRLPSPIDTIVCNSMSTLVLLQNGTMWAWGSNSCGNMANGAGINYNTYAPFGTLQPWGWDQATGETMVTRPVQIGKGKSNFTQIFGTSSLCFFYNATDVNDSMYGWGRNKGGVLGDLVTMTDGNSGDLRALFPNSCDQNYLKYIDPFRNGSIETAITCPYYLINPNYTLGSKYPIAPGSTTHAIVGPNQAISTSYTMLIGHATVTSPATSNWHRHWTIVSIPTGAQQPNIPLPENDTTVINGLSTGTTVVRYAAYNNWFVGDSTTVSITVSLNGNIIPTVNAGPDQTITLPINSITLSGSAIGNSGATIVSTSWSRFSGPSSGTITNNTSLSTTVTNLTAGTYDFRLSAVDNNGSSNTDDILIIVKPAAVLPPSGQRGFYIRTRRTSYQ